MPFSKTIQPDDTILEDTGISGYAPYVDLNFGTSNGFGIRGPVNQGHFLIRLPASQIPDGRIISCKLYLYFWQAFAGQKYSVAPCKRAWTELGATWNKYDGTNAWQTAGGIGANDKDTDIVTGYQPSVGWNNNDITASLVQGWKDGTIVNNGILGYYHSGGNSNDGTDAYSSGYATPANRPYFVITYDNGGSFLMNLASNFKNN